MALTVTFEDKAICRVDATGLLRREDMQQAEAAIAARMAGPASLGLLVVLHEFEGWSDADDWHDLGFYVTHGDDFSRIAIVGAEQWRSHALMFAAAGLRKAPVEYFLPIELGRARAWLAERS